MESYIIGLNNLLIEFFEVRFVDVRSRKQGRNLFVYCSTGCNVVMVDLKT